MINEILKLLGFDEKTEMLGSKCTVLGKYGVYVEGIKKILKISPQEIVVALGKGAICLAGENLSIKLMTKCDVVISGEILKVEFIEN